MVSGSDDVRDITDENSALIHRGRRTLGRGLLRTMQQTKLQGNPHLVSGAASLRIPLTRLLKNKRK
ncbi:unnamed protein product, partial [Protopolystoma xenopodis]